MAQGEKESKTRLSVFHPDTAEPAVLVHGTDQLTPPMIEQTNAFTQLRPPSMLICLSGSKAYQDTANDFSEKFDIRMTQTHGKEVTHVVVHTNDDCDLPQEHRTLKYIWGMAAKKYVVSHLWLIKSLDNGRILPEEEFEVRRDFELAEDNRNPDDFACRRARLKRHKLFADYTFYVLSDNSWNRSSYATALTRGQMIELLELVGAQVVCHPTLLPSPVDSDRMSKELILFPYKSIGDKDLIQEAKRLYKQYGHQVVMADWVLDSITCDSISHTERAKFSMPVAEPTSQKS